MSARKQRLAKLSEDRIRERSEDIKTQELGFDFCVNESLENRWTMLWSSVSTITFETHVSYNTYAHILR